MSAADCYFKYQAASGTSQEKGYCTAKGNLDNRTSILTRITTPDGCAAYANEKNFTFQGRGRADNTNFTASNFGTCKDDYDDGSCSTVRCEKNIAQVCKLTCSSASRSTCGGEAALKAGCVLVDDTKAVWFFAPGDDLTTFSHKENSITPVCEAFECDGGQTVRDFDYATDAGKRPKCTKTDEALKGEEDDKFKTFIIVAIAISTINTIAAEYIAARSKGLKFYKLPMEAHRWVALSVVLKLADLKSDIGFLLINLGAPGDTSNRFYQTYEREQGHSADLIRSFSLFFCVASLALTGPDLYSAYLTKLHKAASQKWLGRAMVCNLLTIVLEDGAQLIITFVYVRAMDFGAESAENQAMTVISIVFAFATIADRVFAVYTLHKAGAKPAIFAAAGGALGDLPAVQPNPTFSRQDSVNTHIPIVDTTVPRDGSPGNETNNKVQRGKHASVYNGFAIESDGAEGSTGV